MSQFLNQQLQFSSFETAITPQICDIKNMKLQQVSVAADLRSLRARGSGRKEHPQIINRMRKLNKTSHFMYLLIFHMTDPYYIRITILD